MPVADRHIGLLDVEVVPGESQAVRFVDLDTNYPGGTWTATAGHGGSVSATVTVGSGDVVTTWAAEDTAAMVGHPVNLYRNDVLKVSGYGRRATPQTTPGEAAVTIATSDEATITVVVEGGGSGDGLTEADVAPVALSGAYADITGTPTLGTAAAEDVEAFDAAGSAAAAQSAAIAAAATDATTKANAAQSAAATDATTKVTAHAAASDPHGDRAYTDTTVNALLEPGAGIGTKRVDDSGIDRVNLSVVKASVIGTSVANTAAETTLLQTPIAFAAGALSMDSVLRFVAYGQYLNNSGANRDVTLRLKFGSHTAYSFVFSAVPTSATNRQWLIEADIGFFNFIGDRCQGSGRASLSAAGSGLDFGTLSRFADTTATVAPASANNVDLTVQHSTNLSTLTATIVGMRYQHLSAA